MIIATIPHEGKRIEVEVLDVFWGSRGKLVRVRALNSSPFTEFSHGGPVNTNMANILPEFLDIVKTTGNRIQIIRSEKGFGHAYS
jgi:hypothetical protein